MCIASASLMGMWSACFHTQKGDLPWGFIVYSHHLKILHTLTFESVFRKRNPMGPWACTGDLVSGPMLTAPSQWPLVSRMCSQPPALPPCDTWVPCWPPAPAPAQGPLPPSVSSRGLDPGYKGRLSPNPYYFEYGKISCPGIVLCYMTKKILRGN